MNCNRYSPNPLFSNSFLDNVTRIADPDYLPTDDDILRARLRTMGVSEHLFEVPTGSSSKTISWRLYDVGGARGQRPSWVPYFEDGMCLFLGVRATSLVAYDLWLPVISQCHNIPCTHIGI